MSPKYYTCNELAIDINNVYYMDAHFQFQGQILKGRWTIGAESSHVLEKNAHAFIRRAGYKAYL